MKDKLFFFGAQEWVNFLAIQTAIITVPTEKMRAGDFSELLNPANGFYNGARTIMDPTTGQPFPGNVIPQNRLSPNGMAILNAYPDPTPGFRQGTTNALITSPNPQDQRKDNIRFDYRMNAKNNFSYRFAAYNWVATDAFRDDLTFARTAWERPNTTSTASWTSTLTSNLINELTYNYSKDNVFINLFTETGAPPAEHVRYQLPVHLPGEGDRPTRFRRSTSPASVDDRRRSVPVVVCGPIHTSRT